MSLSALVEKLARNIPLTPSEADELLRILAARDSFVETIGDTITGKLTIEQQTAVDNALVLQTVDDDATENILETQDAAGNVQVSIGPTGAVVINEEGNDADTRIEGDTDANLLYIDAGNERVGIRTATPGASLDVLGSGTQDRFRVYIDGDQYVLVNQYGTLTSVVPTSAANWLGFGLVGSGDTFARYGFGLDTGTPWMAFGPGNANRDVWLHRNTGNLTFSFGTTPSEKIRFASDGNVGIGATSPGGRIHVVSGTTTTITALLKAIASQTADFLQIQDSAGNELLDIEADGELNLVQDSKYIRVGAGKDAGIMYDGTDFWIEPALVGSGRVKMKGYRRYVELEVFSFVNDEDNATGDGKAYFHVPAHINGMDLAEVHAEVKTAGTTGTLTVQIANVTQAADMLSVALTVDSAETGSDTAATAATIDTTNDDVAENDVLRIDIDAIHTTPAKGLIVTLGFHQP